MKVLRLVPMSSMRLGGPTCTMFDLRDATGATLVTGERWGDDFLYTDDPETFELLKQLMDEADYPYQDVTDHHYYRTRALRTIA